MDENGKPYGIIDGFSLFNFFRQVVGPRLDTSDQRITDIMSAPCREAADTTVPKFPANARIRDMLNRILREEHNDFFVVDENGHYLGVCHQRAVLNPPRLKVVLVDHNEPRQAIAALEEAELLEILDHHRLGNPHTHQPIRFTVDIVGSTSTLVSELTAEAGLLMPPPLAGLLLAGLLADTLILTSPTVTERDKQAANRLARWAFRATARWPGNDSILRPASAGGRRRPLQPRPERSGQHRHQALRSGRVQICRLSGRSH